MDLLRKHFAKDAFAVSLGMEIAEVSPGYAKITMKVLPSMLNAVGTLHGGALFALADFAFAVASNSRGTVSVGINASIAYTKAVAEGAALTAEATEVSDGRKVAVYAVKVTDDAGDVVGQFMGTAYRRKESITDFTKE